jgi:hypothetical protein
VFTAWGNAFLSGAVDPDTASEAIRGRDLTHVVVGLPGAPTDPTTLPVALRVLSRDGVQGLRVVLPVPGDVYGLPGPGEFNAAAAQTGEAVLTAGAEGPAYGLLPHVSRAPQRIEVAWQVHRVESRPVALPALREADRALAGALREATEILASLDVARLDPDSAELLEALRGGAFDGPRVPPGHPPAAVDLAVRGRRLASIVALARSDDGGAMTASEASRRRDALDPVDRAARQALAAAYSAGAPR